MLFVLVCFGVSSVFRLCLMMKFLWILFLLIVLVERCRRKSSFRTFERRIATFDLFDSLLLRGFLLCVCCCNYYYYY